MFENRSDAHERVLEAIEDIKSCCEVKDDFHEWSDVAASSIQAFLEDLTVGQLDDTCGAFREYITETANEDINLARGVKEALVICLNEMLDYIGDVPEYDEESEDVYEDFEYNEQTFYLAEQIRSDISKINKMSV
ncbi:MAG: hypothetical protein K2K57_03295 [Oscillospiraceae bacterium]|nr:hypothetical protein [Oscillospiraceae bacterium]